MTRSHPPTLLTMLERCLRTDCHVQPGDKLVAAVSGGPDSMALLHGLAFVSKKLHFDLLAIGINHGLRPEAEFELKQAQEFSSQLSIPMLIGAIELSPGGNLQARARDARYERIRAMAESYWGAPFFIATAHHREDRAETVLLRLLRGTSLAGLGVLPPRHDDLLRPLIGTPRSSILEHLERHHVPFSTDPSNENPRFLRVRVRNELLPLLSELSPGIVEHLTALADEALSHGEEGMGLCREERSQLTRALRDPKAALDLRLGHGLRLFRE